MSFMSRLFSNQDVKGSEITPRADYLDVLRLSEMLNKSILDTNPLKKKSEQVDNYLGWVFIAIGIISEDMAFRPFTLSRDEKVIDVHPVIKRPNIRQTWGDFVELSMLHYLLTGEIYWNLITETPGGVVNGIQCIPPNWVDGYKISNSKLTHWKVTIPGQTQIDVPSIDVIFINHPCPDNPLKGMSPIEAFALSHNIDLYSRAYTSELLKNRARPDGYISMDVFLNEEQADVYRNRWLDRYGESRTTEGPAIFGKGAKYTPISLSIADLAFMELAQLSRDQILGCYRVPASKLGLTEDANLANSREASNTYAENALVPRMNKLQSAINTFLLPRLYNNKEQIYFEYESPIIRDVEAIANRSRQNLLSGNITVNEHRNNIGLEPRDDGDVLFIPMGFRVVDKIEVYDPMRIPVEQINSVKKLSDSDYELSGMRFNAAQSKLESGLKAKARKLFSKESKMIVAAYKDKENKSVATEEFVENILATTRAEWGGAIEDTCIEAVERGFDLFADEIPAQFQLSFDIFQPESLKWSNQRAGEAIVGIHKKTREEVGTIISDAIKAGDSIDKITATISEKFNQYKGARAKAIARTETSNAVNNGKLAHAKESERRFDVAYLKTWNPVAGSIRTREWHKAQNISPSQTIPMYEKFSVNGETMERPLDPNGSASNVVNCRCTLTFEVLE